MSPSISLLQKSLNFHGFQESDLSFFCSTIYVVDNLRFFCWDCKSSEEDSDYEKKDNIIHSFFYCNSDDINSFFHKLLFINCLICILFLNNEVQSGAIQIKSDTFWHTSDPPFPLWHFISLNCLFIRHICFQQWIKLFTKCLIKANFSIKWDFYGHSLKPPKRLGPLRVSWDPKVLEKSENIRVSWDTKILKYQKIVFLMVSLDPNIIEFGITESVPKLEKVEETRRTCALS